MTAGRPGAIRRRPRREGVDIPDGAARRPRGVPAGTLPFAAASGGSGPFLTA